MDQKTAHCTTHALLVGVDDYTSFDGTPNWNLDGSVANVYLLAAYCRQVLHLPADQIHVLTDKPPQELPPGVLCKGKPTLQEVRDHLNALLKGTKGPVLFAFSGHGAWKEGAEETPVGPVLCLYGTTPALDGVLPLRDLRALVEQTDAKGRLVAVLDCCHVANPVNLGHGGQVLQTTSLPNPKAKVTDDKAFSVSDRVLLAAHPGKPGYQMRLGTIAHGALTFGLVLSADRWLATDGASHGSYKNVWQRAKGVIKALGVKQAPMMHLPGERWVEIRKQPFLGIRPGYTVKKPDARETSVQVDGGWTVSFTMNDNLVAWFVTPTTNASVSLQVSTPAYATGSTPSENWYVATQSLPFLTSAVVDTTTITMNGTNSIAATVPTGYLGKGGYNVNAPYIAANINAEPSNWTESTLPTFTGTCYWFSGNTGGYTVWIGFDYTSGTNTLNKIVWAVVTSTAPASWTVPNVVVPTTGATFTYQGNSGATSPPEPTAPYWSAVSVQKPG